MICPICGKNIEDGSAVCPNCANTLFVTPQYDAPVRQQYEQQPAQPQYAPQQPQYVPQQPQYAPQQQYDAPVQQQQYAPPAQPQYAPQQQQYAPQQPQYAPQQPQYAPQQQYDAPVQQQQYAPPAQTQYVPQQQQYAPPAQTQYVPQQQQNNDMQSQPANEAYSQNQYSYQPSGTEAPRKNNVNTKLIIILSAVFVLALTAVLLLVFLVKPGNNYPESFNEDIKTLSNKIGKDSPLVTVGKSVGAVVDKKSFSISYEDMKYTCIFNNNLALETLAYYENDRIYGLYHNGIAITFDGDGQTIHSIVDVTDEYGDNLSIFSMLFGLNTDKLPTDIQLFDENGNIDIEEICYTYGIEAEELGVDLDKLSELSNAVLAKFSDEDFLEDALGFEQDGNTYRFDIDLNTVARELLPLVEDAFEDAFDYDSIMDELENNASEMYETIYLEFEIENGLLMSLKADLPGSESIYIEFDDIGRATLPLDLNAVYYEAIELLDGETEYNQGYNDNDYGSYYGSYQGKADEGVDTQFCSELQQALNNTIINYLGNSTPNDTPTAGVYISGYGYATIEPYGLTEFDNEINSILGLYTLKSANKTINIEFDTNGLAIVTLVDGNSPYLVP